MKKKSKEESEGPPMVWWQRVLMIFVAILTIIGINMCQDIISGRSSQVTTEEIPATKTTFSYSEAMEFCSYTCTERGRYYIENRTNSYECRCQLTPEAAYADCKNWCKKPSEFEEFTTLHRCTCKLNETDHLLREYYYERIASYPYANE